jgi:hypothetical protein
MCIVTKSFVLTINSINFHVKPDLAGFIER